MYTFEDNINAKTVSFGSSDENDTSTVLMVTVDKKKFFITADMTNKLFVAASSSISLFTQSEGGAKKQTMACL